MMKGPPGANPGNPAKSSRRWWGRVSARAQAGEGKGYWSMCIAEEMQLWEELADSSQEWESTWPSDGPGGFYLEEEIEEKTVELIALGYSRDRIDYYISQILMIEEEAVE